MATEVFNDRTYVKENQATAVEERIGSEKGVRASATINAVSSPGHNDRIQIRNFNNSTGGGVIIFVTSGGTGGDPQIIDIEDDPGVDVVYQRLKTKIEDLFGGTILCEIDTSPSGPGGTNVSLVLTLSTPGSVPGTSGQAGFISFSGPGGYDGIYNDDPPTKFTGGVDPTPNLTTTGAQFLLGTKSTINIRGQSPTSRYEVFLGEEKT